MNGKLYYIYKMESPSGKIYIGITKNVSRRKAQHKSNAKRSEARLIKRKIVQAVKKYGMGQMNFKCIVTAFSQEDAKELEKVLISQYDSFNNGYNLTEGGDSTTVISKINNEQLEEIRVLLETTSLSLRKIGNKYGLDPVTVFNIQNGKSWSDVGNYRKIIRDKSSYARGSSVTVGKLTEENVYEIKKLSTEGWTATKISKKFNVSKTTICYILKGKTWKHVKFEGLTRPKHRGNSKLTESQVRRAWELKLDNKLIDEVSDITGIKYHTLYAIFAGKNWKDLYEEYNAD